jgi:hypothetical protein
LGWDLLVDSCGQLKDESGSLDSYRMNRVHVDSYRMNRVPLKAESLWANCEALAAQEGLSSMVFVNRRILAFEHEEASHIFVFRYRMWILCPLCI